MPEQPRLQEIYDEIRAMKKERKDLNEMIKDELSHNERYQEILEEMKTLRAEKKSIETEVREAVPADAARLDDIKIEIRSNEELLSDLAFNMLVNEVSIEISDEYANRYEPLFTVKFKKAGTVEETKE